MTVTVFHRHKTKTHSDRDRQPVSEVGKVLHSASGVSQAEPTAVSCSRTLGRVTSGEAVALEPASPLLE